MAKLTVYFKDKVVHSGLFESGIVHIGRDETNDLIIDSLAVAPVHAAIIIGEDGCTIKQLADDFPIIINGAKIKESILKDDDTITIGKHDIVFRDAGSKNPQRSIPEKAIDPVSQAVNMLNQEISNDVNIPDANLQVLAGNNIGKLIPLKNSITRLGHSGSGVVVIERRKEAYFVSLLEKKGDIKLNDQPLSDNEQKMKNQDVLRIDNISLQFFQS